MTDKSANCTKRIRNVRGVQQKYPLVPLKKNELISDWVYENREGLLSKFLDNMSIDQEKGCWVWEGNKANGYGSVSIPIQGEPHPRGGFYTKTKCLRVPRVVGMLCLGCVDDPNVFVCHHCDLPACFNPDHLFVGTCEDNHKDMILKGRKALGSEMRKSHLANLDVLTLRSIYEYDPTISYKTLATLVGVSPTCVRDIILRRTWTHTYKGKGFYG